MNGNTIFLSEQERACLAYVDRVHLCDPWDLDKVLTPPGGKVLTYTEREVIVNKLLNMGVLVKCGVQTHQYTNATYGQRLKLTPLGLNLIYPLCPISRTMSC